MKVLFIPKKLGLLFIAIFIIFGIGTWYIVKPEVVETTGTTSTEKKVINMVTGEFKSAMDDGKEIEAYRWDPGTIYIPHDQPVELSIFGVNGKEHPFYIEGTNIEGIVKKGEETIVKLHFKEEGIYRLICKTHPDIEHNGPMIAYIVVD